MTWQGSLLSEYSPAILLGYRAPRLCWATKLLSGPPSMHCTTVSSTELRMGIDVAALMVCQDLPLP